MNHPKNLAMSVRQRLLNRAKSEQRPFNELLYYFAMERLLYRLSKSKHADRFVLKGALMLRVWRSPEIRPTMDIDLLGRGNNEQEEIVIVIRDVLNTDVEDDGLVFDTSSIQAERMKEDAEYEGIRIRFSAALDSARIVVRIDIGFGDVVYPPPKRSDLPTVLDFPAARLLCYSRESSIAEKLEAMIKLGNINSRMKDFYDIWLLARQFDFDRASLAEAIRVTFQRRQTALPSGLEILTEPFMTAKQAQWKAFRERLGHGHVPASFHEIAAVVDAFLSPVLESLSSNRQQEATRWTAPGNWS